MKTIFEYLSLNRQIELNLLSKWFHNEIIPELMFNKERQVIFDLDVIQCNLSVVNNEIVKFLSYS